jgi:hypothetical protein
MCNKRRTWSRFWLLPLLALGVTTAHADTTTARYAVAGATGASLWGIGEEPGTEALVFAFTQATPEPGDPSAAGPRIFFSVTRWELAYDRMVRQQWYGSVALPPEALGVGADLAEGALDATVLGTLEEQSETGVELHRDMPGHLKIHWVAGSDRASTTASYSLQTPAYTTLLQTKGEGRAATVDATVSVEALGDPIHLTGPGSLSAITEGTLEVTLQ